MEDNQGVYPYEFRVCTIETDNGEATYIEYEDEIVEASMGVTQFLQVITDKDWEIK